MSKQCRFSIMGSLLKLFHLLQTRWRGISNSLKLQWKHHYDWCSVASESILLQFYLHMFDLQFPSALPHRGANRAIQISICMHTSDELISKCILEQNMHVKICQVWLVQILSFLCKADNLLFSFPFLAESGNVETLFVEWGEKTVFFVC